MEEEKFKDLLEDEELTSLRLAALATKRSKEKSADNLNYSATALPINSIVTSAASASESTSNQIPFVQSDRNAYNSIYSWRKQNQTSRRRGGAFPKNSTRSNLIVISPVALNDGKDLEDKAPSLVLPQHKWCNSGNEDSMSPKTLRRTGPTRFNRHGSDSESSESDYENDNDSGSNETVLQDEPTEHFSRLSPDSDTVPDNVEKKRRLSFQNLEPEMKSDTFDKSETTSIYNLLKNPSYDSSDKKLDNLSSVQNKSDGRLAWNHSVENDYSSYKQFNNGNVYESENSIAVKQNSLVVSNGDEGNNFRTQSADASWQHTDIKSNNAYFSGETAIFERGQEINDRKANYTGKRQLSSEMQNCDVTAWQHDERPRSNKSFFQRETSYNSADSRNYKNEDASMQFLGDGDKKRNLNPEMKSKSIDIENPNMLEIGYSQNNTWDRSRQENSYEENVNDVSCVNSFGNKECSNFQRNRNEYNLNINGKRHERSGSRERIRQDRCSSRERSRYGYSSGPERSRNDRSSSQCRSRRGRSNSRGRSRRSVSQDRRRIEHSSSPGKQRQESIPDPKNKSGCSFSEERDGHIFSQNRSSYEHNFSQAKSRNEYNSSQNKSKHVHSPGHYRSRREHSSSSDSRHERSKSRDRSLEFSSSRSRNRKDRSLSRDRKRYDRSSSRERSQHVHSSSQEKDKYERSSSGDRSTESEDSKTEHTRNYVRKRHDDSSSQDESEEDYSPRQRRNYNKHTSSDTISTYKKHNSKGRCDVNSTQDKDKEGYASSQEILKDCNKTSEVRKPQDTIFKSERENIKFEKSGIKEKSKSAKGKSRLLDSSNEGKKKGNKISLVKQNQMKDSHRNHYPRSRSSSSTSSSSSSSSSTSSSRPKIRSVSSVVNYVPPKITDVQKEQTHSEVKSVGKNISLNISQSDVFSTSSKRNIEEIKNIEYCSKLSSFKSSRVDLDFKASDNSKRVPVHMRLGVLPRKRVIQMPKDVEAAFVNSSSSSDSENVNTKCKRQNIRIVTDVCDDKSGFVFENKHSSKDGSKRSPDLSQEKSKRLKIKR